MVEPNFLMCTFFLFFPFVVIISLKQVSTTRDLADLFILEAFMWQTSSSNNLNSLEAVNKSDYSDCVVHLHHYACRDSYHHHYHKAILTLIAE